MELYYLNLLKTFNINAKNIMKKGQDYLWKDSFDKPEVTSGRINVLERNLADVIMIVYSLGLTTLFNVDMGLQEIYKKSGVGYVELGGGSVGASVILDQLTANKILERLDNPYRGFRLKRKYRDFLDAIFLRDLASAA